MFELICAVDSNYAIGQNNRLPWNCKNELIHFKNITKGSTLIMGRKTCESLPYLENRNIICLSRNKNLDITNWKNKENTVIVNSVNQILSMYNTSTTFFVAGGSDIYELFLSNKLCSVIHISYMKIKADNPDTYFNRNLLSDFKMTYIDDGLTTDQEFIYCKFEYSNDTPCEEKQYLSIASDILTNNIKKEGRNGPVISSFVNHMKFDLRTGFPLLTTKKMFLRGIIEELLFFKR